MTGIQAVKMPGELAQYKHAVGSVNKYSTEYTWTLNNWSLLYYSIYKKGIASTDFNLNGINGCTCKALFFPNRPTDVFNLQFSDTQEIGAMQIIIRTDSLVWDHNYCKPISKTYRYILNTEKDVPKNTLEPNRNDAVIIVIKITIVKTPDLLSLLKSIELPPSKRIKSNPPQNILANFKKMFDREAFCDITLVLGDQTFHAHKAVLAAQSKVFEAMFSSGLKEQNANTIEISNFDAEVFDEFLDYLYGEEEIELEGIVEEIIVIADFYNVSELKTRCENIMLKSLSENSAVRYVILADKMNCDELKTAALELIRNSTTIIEKALLEEDIVTMTQLKEILSKNQSEA